MRAQDPLALLDQLDALRAEASKAPWQPVGGTHDREIVDDHGCHTATAGTVPDAALIVAAVNALPKLTAALRDVLAECESAERDVSELLGLRMGLRIASNIGSDTIRAAIAAALTPEQVPS